MNMELLFTVRVPVKYLLLRYMYVQCFQALSNGITYISLNSSLFVYTNVRAQTLITKVDLLFTNINLDYLGIILELGSLFFSHDWTYGNLSVALAQGSHQSGVVDLGVH